MRSPCLSPCGCASQGSGYWDWIGAPSVGSIALVGSSSAMVGRVADSATSCAVASASDAPALGCVASSTFCGAAAAAGAAGGWAGCAGSWAAGAATCPAGAGVLGACALAPCRRRCSCAWKLASLGEPCDSTAACGEEAGVSRWEYSDVFHAPRDATELMADRLEGLLSEGRSSGSGSGTENVLTACKAMNHISTSSMAG